MAEQTVPPDRIMLKALWEVPGAVWRTYLAPEVKVMYMSLNKNACTTLKWLMADLAGEDLSGFKAGWQPYVVDAEAIHNRDLWKVSPKLNKMSPAQRMELQSGGWFVFAVVRDPRARLFSAWQNKLLIQTPHGQRWARESWYPRHPLDADTVVADFAKFVDLLERSPDHWLRAEDPHFRDQVELLVEPVVPYSRIYEISELSALREDLSSHLRAQGHPGEIDLPRANPTPLRATAAPFGDGVREQIERIYRADFERFGEVFSNSWDFARIEAAAPWTEGELAACEYESRLGMRIAELHTMARHERDRLAMANTRIQELEEQLTTPARPEGERRSLRSVAARLRAR